MNETKVGNTGRRGLGSCFETAFSTGTENDKGESERARGGEGENPYPGSKGSEDLSKINHRLGRLSRHRLTNAMMD